MKTYKLFLASAAVLALASCSKIETIAPESGTMLASQVQETNTTLPERASASFTGMFTSIGESAKMYSTPDDWEFLMIMFCNDLEGADAIMPDSGYNWFSVCGDYSSRAKTYRNPDIRYRAPYNMISSANTFITSFPADVDDPSILNMIAQAKCLRAYSYMMLAPDYQFTYSVAANEPCVPIVTPETVDFTQNPRATVAEVYEEIIKDLSEAVTTLEKAEVAAVGRATKMYINADVAHGLRARAYLTMGKWQEAYDDAVAAAKNYEPASIAEVSKPSFMDISEHNWIWGYDMTADVAMSYRYATTSSWLRSFSAWGYSPACQVYCYCNPLLWDKISATDVRKGWWVDENLESPLLEGLAWPGFSDVANADDGGDTKTAYIPYTNVKFGCNTIGTTSNDEDMPLMRVEEMILIQAECKAHLGDDAACKTIIENFVTKYRDPEYSWIGNPGNNAIDKVWFQRRVELWGEGFYTQDMHRLNKPLVRFHDVACTDVPNAFRFNMPADDEWFLMRFPQGETNTNFGIVDNVGGTMPVMYQHPELRDGVTD